MSRTTVPRLEPEVIAAAVRRQRGDAEKVATTALKGFDAFGVYVTSRWNKAAELELMAKAIAQMGAVRSGIESIFCDSKAGADYSIMLGEGTSDDLAEAAVDGFAEAILALGGGYNGIWVQGGSRDLSRDPMWAGDQHDEP